MRWLAAWLGLAWGLTLLLATPARAQVAPPPAEPWSLSFGAGEVYDSNLNFSPGTGSGGAGEFGSQIYAGGSRTWTGRRGGGSLNGNAADSFYSHATDFNAFTYGVGASGSYQVTRRLTWTANDTLSSAYAQDTTLLTNAGLLLPKIIVRTNSATSAFSYALSPKSQIIWGLTTTAVGFASPQFAGATNVGTNFNFSRQLGTSQTLGISYDYQITNSSGIR
jgi:hypothetical protein